MESLNPPKESQKVKESYSKSMKDSGVQGILEVESSCLQPQAKVLPVVSQKGGYYSQHPDASKDSELTPSVAAQDSFLGQVESLTQSSHMSVSPPLWGGCPGPSMLPSYLNCVLLLRVSPDYLRKPRRSQARPLPLPHPPSSESLSRAGLGPLMVFGQ